MNFEYFKEPFYTILAGISGGLINLYFNNQNDLHGSTVSIFKIIMALLFGFSGAIFIAPLAIEYLNISGRSMYGIIFITSVLTELLLLTFVKLFTAFVKDPFLLIKLWLQTKNPNLKFDAPKKDIEQEDEGETA